MGPVIGGALSDPLENHPEWFGKDSRPAFFVKFPFALPNLVCSLFFLIGIPVGILFLDVSGQPSDPPTPSLTWIVQETLETCKDRPDAGRALGRKLSRWISEKYQGSSGSNGERTSLLSSGEEGGTVTAVPEQAPPRLLEAFTFQSSMNVIYYVFLALHSITFDQLLPVFLSYPQQGSSGWQLPFRFAGGLGMSSSRVGKVFSLYGITGMTLQV